MIAEERSGPLVEGISLLELMGRANVLGSASEVKPRVRMAVSALGDETRSVILRATVSAVPADSPDDGEILDSQDERVAPPGVLFQGHVVFLVTLKGRYSKSLQQEILEYVWPWIHGELSGLAARLRWPGVAERLPVVLTTRREPA
jgi:hypothetical protein